MGGRHGRAPARALVANADPKRAEAGAHGWSDPPKRKQGVAGRALASGCVSDLELLRAVAQLGRSKTSPQTAEAEVI